MCPLVPTLNCVKLKDYLLVPVTIHTICMVLFMPTKTVGTHAATCDRVVLVMREKEGPLIGQAAHGRRAGIILLTAWPIRGPFFSLIKMAGN